MSADGGQGIDPVSVVIVVVVTVIYLAVSAIKSEKTPPPPEKPLYLWQSSCSNIANELGGSYTYERPDGMVNIVCTVTVNNYPFHFYSNEQIEGVRFGLTFAHNKPRLKLL